MWMLTLNVILGYQGLLFLDFLWMLYFVLYSWRVCSCHCCWPSSFLPSRVASNRAQGFSSKVDILEICPSCLLPKAGTVFEINVHVITFPRNFCLLFNLLNPKSDNHWNFSLKYHCFRRQSGHENWVHESGQMSLTDISTNSPHYFYWKSIGTVNGNLNFDIRVWNVNRQR